MLTCLVFGLMLCVSMAQETTGPSLSNSTRPWFLSWGPVYSASSMLLGITIAALGFFLALFGILARKNEHVDTTDSIWGRAAFAGAGLMCIAFGGGLFYTSIIVR